jgi:hypothetical protein
MERIPMKGKLHLTPVAPIASQLGFFSSSPEPAYPTSTRNQGDHLRSARQYDLGLTLARAAELLGITANELLEAERGAYSFELADALRLLRGSK